MGDMKVGKTANVEPGSVKQGPKEASKEVQKHLIELKKMGKGEAGEKILKGAGTGAAAGAAAGAVLTLANPVGALVGAAAGAAAGAGVAAGKLKGEAKEKQLEKLPAKEQKLEPKKLPADKDSSEQVKSAAKTAVGAGIGAALLGVPGAALGVLATSDFVADKAKAAWQSIQDFASKNADKMQAAAEK